ncbi:receptor-like protein 13 [Ricinus communis]|uniref:receptor-like protein 13 n=1 Tax=Ricinus communis TaxID=3988 RepID=UPI00201ABEED|nr:receptor-like protein 13 [Ricinus communis]
MLNTIHNCFFFFFATGFERLSTLENLEILNLGYNNFNNNILSFFSDFSSLKSLYMNDNKLKGILNVEGILHLFLFFFLSYNLWFLTSLSKAVGFVNVFFVTIVMVFTYCNLEYLDLSFNHFDNNVLSFLKGLSSLKTLDISYNQLKGPFDLKELEAWSKLKKLSLGGNEIHEFISSTGFPVFRNLQHLYLDSSTLNNSFLQSIGTLTSLKALSLSKCGLTGTIPSTQGLCELKHLECLDISFNSLSGNLPWCLANLTSLQQLVLSWNHFNGNISLSPLSSLTSIYDLKLSHNMFQISISLNPFVNLSKLTHFSGWSNIIYAETEVEDMIPKFQLKMLYLSGDGYGGVFSKFLYHQYDLEMIELSNIKFREKFPYWLLDNNTNLEELYLANNSLSEPLQLPIHSHTNLSASDISDNSFHGRIPIQIGAYFPSLTELKMSTSGFHGSIPNSIGNMSSLTYLDFSNNQFSGNIPNSIGNMPSLYVLALTDNDVSGSLPSNFSLSSISEIHLSRNRIQGSLEHAFFRGSDLLIVLDLSHNHMTGSIPSWIGGLPQLGYLILSNNNFEGEISIQLRKLNYLSVVDLSHNKLTGPIHPCLKCSSNPDRIFHTGVNDLSSNMEGHLELIMKSLSLSYEGMIATYISGIDFSCNNFTGSIPHEFGNLSEIKLLNLSHNSLIGSILTTFFNLSQIESLDLSNNKLQGSIPLELTKLYSLAAFNVSYNNLCSRIPEGVAQFGTFNESNYIGNPFLYGCPLLKNCNARESPPSVSRASTHSSESMGLIDVEVFYMSFGVSYLMVLLGIAVVLYIISYWRRVWFYYIQVSMDNCYYFIIDNFFKFKFLLR